MNNNKDLRNISELRLWKSNPRSIGTDAYEALKNKIKRFGQFKPVIITANGEVLGGNMRLRAMRELGINEVWVSVVEPKNEAEKLEISMADNESAGRWDELALAELLEPYKDEIKLEDYELDLGYTTGLDILLARLGPEGEEIERAVDQDTTDQKLETYLEGGIRQIVLYFSKEEYEQVVDKFNQVRESENVTNNTEVVLKLFKVYEDTRNKV